MVLRYPLFSERIPSLLHGADYNPEQWLNYPEILEEDMRLMRIAKCNVMSVGIFSWAFLEPEEGVFSFDWLDDILDRLLHNNIYVFLATPSGARPSWMAQTYPEVLRVQSNRVRNLYGLRHNHCLSSPIYREKVAIINSELAKRYSEHPAVIGWHVSNEYGGDCHCDHCQTAFRTWLQKKYRNLDALNHAWWSSFWSHTITDWSQIESPAPHGENKVHGLNLDWKRFVTDQTIDFFEHEIAPLRKSNPNLPVTTNFMALFDGLDYWKFAQHVDFVSWDSYPTWHDTQGDSRQAARVSMIHDMSRAMKCGQPFVLMESTPSMTNWQPVSKLKRPGMHLLSSIQAVAHGADSVQYFQWRKSRGASEKLHGAVVDHVGHENTRVFSDVAQVGTVLAELEDVPGTTVKPQVALIFDWENRWAIRDAQGPRNYGMNYEQTVLDFYEAFWERGLPVDVVGTDTDFSKYKVVIAPMMYMVKNGFGEKIEEYVHSGGVVVTTYWSGIVDENDLAFLGGFPGPLRKTLGIWSEEIDALYSGEHNHVAAISGNALGLNGTYTAHELCELIHLETARALAVYEDDFYAGYPAITVNELGKGLAYYIASRNTAPFYRDFIDGLIETHGLNRVLNSNLPHGVTAQLRTDGETDYIFLLNFSRDPHTLRLPSEALSDALTGKPVEGVLSIEKLGVRILKRSAAGYF